MNKSVNSHLQNLHILLSLIIFVTLSRITLLPFINHLPNFSAASATALFCGAYTRKWWMAYLIAFLSIFIGDIFLNRMLMHDWMLFYPGCYWQYTSYLLITLMGTRLKNKMNFYHRFQLLLFLILFIQSAFRGG